MPGRDDDRGGFVGWFASGRPADGLGREVGIAFGIASRLASDGWDIAFCFRAEYDETVNGGAGDIARIEAELQSQGARTLAIGADLADVDSGSSVLDAAAGLGPVQALVLSHAHSTNASILSETVESFDRHFAVNARASWLLMREFAQRFSSPHGAGRIVALTSDAVVDEVSYGASKAALDRLVLAASREFGDLGISANLVNPGPIDTGWMTPEVRSWAVSATPAGRLGKPSDIGALVAFLLSSEGGWINGQLLKADGGFSALR